jgi:hypothetical protein
MIIVSFVLLVGVAISAACIWAAIDAASQPEWAFEAAGTNKVLWIVLPIVGLFMCVVGIVASVLWFSTFKPRVVDAARRGPGVGPASL